MAIIRKKTVQSEKPLSVSDMTEVPITMQNELNLDENSESSYRPETEENQRPNEPREMTGSFESGKGTHDPHKHRRKKIRVELIKESSSLDEEEAGTSPESGGYEESTERNDGDNGSSDFAVGSDETTEDQVVRAVRAVKKPMKAKKPERIPGTKEKVSINDLTRMSLPDLREQAVRLGISHNPFCR